MLKCISLLYFFVNKIIIQKVFLIKLKIFHITKIHKIKCLQCMTIRSLISLRINRLLEIGKKEVIKPKRVMETEHKQEIQVI